MSAAVPAAAQLSPGITATKRIQLHWFVSVVCVCTSFSLCVFCVYHYRQQVYARATLEAMINQIDRQQSLVDTFLVSFTSMQADQQDIPHTRVRWAERLQTGLAGLSPLKVKFVIEDAEQIQTDLPDLALQATVLQHPVRIESTLANDEQLMDLLGILSGFQSELFENRGCEIKKQRAGSTLHLNCLYSIYDIELTVEGSQ